MISLRISPKLSPLSTRKSVRSAVRMRRIEIEISISVWRLGLQRYEKKRNRDDTYILFSTTDQSTICQRAVR